MATRAIVCGAGGFIGHHVVRRLKAEGCMVRGVDLHLPRFGGTNADEFLLRDLRDPRACRKALEGGFDEVYQFAADMGGAGYVFDDANAAAIMRNSAAINLNVLEACRGCGCGRVFFASSACVYPLRNQRDPARPDCAEDGAYPAEPDSEYGWEKLFAERLYLAHARNDGLGVRIARYHNVFGPEGEWCGGREKAPAAVCRKVAQAPEGGEVEIWGDGMQTRSFLHVDECCEGTLRLMRSDWTGPVNIGSEEMVTLDGLVDMVADIAGKTVRKRHVPGPVGVRGRTSDNRLVRKLLGWSPSRSLREGLEQTYAWVEAQVRAAAEGRPA
ncbi:MAG: NAD-dependent epimerase/dehydratase family protein [Desulfovibrio sp.]|jgi:nucleoside-diphosphate-sugar epimerase|nr:NAD-dependent epimerase/dehydratase family protein [Desulfovibrio sp.]